MIPTRTDGELSRAKLRSVRREKGVGVSMGARPILKGVDHQEMEKGTF